MSYMKGIICQMLLLGKLKLKSVLKLISILDLLLISKQVFILI